MKRKLRVYLSLSKAASYPLYNKVIKRFSELSDIYNLEVKYYKGGVYDNKDLLESDVVFVVPPYVEGDDRDLLSRGNHDEILIAKEKGLDVFLIEKDLLLSKIDAVYKLTGVNANWQTHYASAHCSKTQLSMVNTLIELFSKLKIDSVPTRKPEDTCNKEYTSESSTSNKNLLLILKK